MSSYYSALTLFFPLPLIPGIVCFTQSFPLILHYIVNSYGPLISVSTAHNTTFGPDLEWVDFAIQTNNSNNNQ